MSDIEEGQPAPDFELPTDGGGTFKLSDHAGKSVVLYFYPKDDTPGCTVEAIAFSGLAKDFAAANAMVVGISPDSPASHDKFKEKHELTVQLAADTEKEVAEAYGVWVKKNRYGREYMGVNRATFLIGPDGKVARIWPKVKVEGHAEEVLGAIKDSG